MCEKSGSGHLLCVEAVDVQYSHLLDYCAFPGFASPCEREEGRGTDGVSIMFQQGEIAAHWIQRQEKRKERATDSAACHLNTLPPGSIVLHKSNTGTSEHTIQAR